MSKIKNPLGKYFKNPVLIFSIIVVFVPINYSFLESRFNSTEADAQTSRPKFVSITASEKSEDSRINPKESAIEHASKHADPKYICPMHAEIISKDPDATCPICGMDLVVLEESGEAGVVKVNAAIIEAIGIRTKKSVRKTLYQRIDSVGYVTYNERNIRRISLRTDAWIERLYINTVGEKIKKGDLIFEVYSPKLVNAQEEYLQAFKFSNQDMKAFISSRERLISLGISHIQIKRLKDTQKVDQLVSIYAPQNGVVTHLNYREGDFIPASTSVVSLADLNSVWLLADIFESQISWVQGGQKAVAKLSNMSGKILMGKVEYIYPSVDQKTRSVKARLIFDNTENLLKPNMYASVAIFAKPKQNALAIPREAVIRTGTQNRVIVSLGDGRYKPEIVQIGIETESDIEILSGIEDGVEVVVSNQFLIDSESSIRAAIQKLSGS